MIKSSELFKIRKKKKKIKEATAENTLLVKM